jgi:hypothetical protein
MFTDARIAAAFESLLGEMQPPPVPLAAIRGKTACPHPFPRRRPSLRFAAAAAAVAVLVCLVVPSVAPGLAQTVESEIQALLQWKPPPPAPRSVWSAMRPAAQTLATAQAQVAFKIVPPAGLPSDVVSEKISTIAAGVYSKATHSWSVGSRAVTFNYRRADGRSFMLTAHRFDSREGPPSKYIFNADEHDARGLPVRHDVYTWRNGDQAMSGVAGEGISATEIAAIRGAMRGVVVPGVWPPSKEGPDVEYRLP